MTEGGGFRRVALETHRDDDWSLFLQEYEVTKRVPTCLPSHGSAWLESRRAGPSLGTRPLLGPMQLDWQTGGVAQKVTDKDIPSCHLQ